jgi:hypothetical protein
MTSRSLQTHAPHKPRYGAARDLFALPVQLPPHLAHAIDLEVLVIDAPYLLAKDRVPARSGRGFRRVTPGNVSPVQPIFAAIEAIAAHCDA